VGTQKTRFFMALQNLPVEGSSGNRKK